MDCTLNSRQRNKRPVADNTDLHEKPWLLRQTNFNSSFFIIHQRSGFNIHYLLEGRGAGVYGFLDGNRGSSGDGFVLGRMFSVSYGLYHYIKDYDAVSEMRRVFRGSQKGG
ncbi:MAG: hypothetical protein ACI4XW_09335 [Candidatus Spyradocola sp.]